MASKPTNVNITGTISASNPSVGTLGSAAPLSATLIGIKNAAGNLANVTTTSDGNLAVTNVSTGGETAITSPADGSTITLNTDTLITFSSPVNRIRMQNEHATAKVYWRTDAVSSPAFNLVPPGSNLIEWVGVHTTVLHIYSDTTLTNLFNAAGGFKVRGYA